MQRWIGWAIALGGAMACFGGGNDGGSAGSGASAACARAVQQFRACGLLSQGEAKCGDVDSAEIECLYECVQTTPCATLENAICSDTDIADVPEVEECALACIDALRFDCADGSDRVRPGAVCDGESDCLDGSDEADCMGSAFLCAEGGGAVRIDRVCDGDIDCPDASDESGCPEGSFTCADGSETLPSDWRCDGNKDCADRSDEAACPGEADLLCRGVPVSPGFSCADGSERIDADWQCDGSEDCADGSDELDCGDFLPPPDVSPIAPCAPGSKSVPGDSGDPCPQVGTMCAAVGGNAVACCAQDGGWEMSMAGTIDCMCQQASMPVGCGN